MTPKGLRAKILKVIEGSKLASLATIASGKPWVRYAISRSQGLTLYICTFRGSRKVKQIQKNPNVHITIGGSMEHMDAPYVQITAKAKIRGDSAIRKKLWLDFMKKYYTGVDDPEYVVIEAKPEVIEYMDSETHKPERLLVRPPIDAAISQKGYGAASNRRSHKPERLVRK